MKPLTEFTDDSNVSRIEKAKRVLKSLSSPTNYRYFHDDGYPRHKDILRDAAATLEVLEQLSDNITLENKP